MVDNFYKRINFYTNRGQKNVTFFFFRKISFLTSILDFDQKGYQVMCEIDKILSLKITCTFSNYPGPSPRLSSGVIFLITT